MPDPAVKITAMILIALMSLVASAACLYAVREEHKRPGGWWWLVAIAAGAGVAALWGGVARLAGIELG